MRRKQFLALFMAGALTMSMAPAAALAAGDEAALSIEDSDAGSFNSVEEATEEEPPLDVEEIIPEEPVETPSEPTEAPELPAEELPTDAPENPADLPAEPSVDFPQDAPLGEGAVEAAAEPEATPTPGETAASIVIGETVYTSFAEAIAAVPENGEEATQIQITGKQEISEAVSIPANKNIVIAAAAEDTQITRGAGYTGSLFTVDGGTLHLSGGTVVNTDGSDTVGTLTVDGSTADGTQVEGSLIEVNGGYFGLSDGVTLTGNSTTGNGGAIRNTAGMIILFGGTISGNQAAQGGAIYSEGAIGVQGSVAVIGNIKTEGLEENNITLKGDAAVINVTGALADSMLGVDVEDPAEGRQVVAIPTEIEGVTMEDVLAQFVYNGDEAFMLDAEGKLASTAVSPTPTPEEEPLKVKAVSMEWTGYDSLKLVGNSNKDGQYYVAWVPKGHKAPSFDPSKKDGDVIADYDFTAFVTDLPAEEVDIYVCVQDNNGNHHALLYQPNYKKRPAAPVTPTPDHVPVIPKVTESTVSGLEKPLEFYPNTFYPFTVIGAGTDNKNPGPGDVKWVPVYWSTSSNPSNSQKHTAWKIGTTAGIKDANTFNLYVFFQKAVYDGTSWKMTDTVESATYKFMSKQITIASPTPSTDPYGNGGGNGGSGGDYDDPDNVDDPDDYSDEADDTKAAVATGDETPVGTMLMLAAASVLAGGYVLVRRRKKDI